MIKYETNTLTSLLLWDRDVNTLRYTGFIILSLPWHRARQDHLTHQLSHCIFCDVHIALLT